MSAGDPLPVEPFLPGNVYQVVERPGTLWVVLEAKPGRLRGAWLSLHEGIGWTQPGATFELEEGPLGFETSGVRRVA